MPLIKLVVASSWAAASLTGSATNRNPGIESRAEKRIPHGWLWREDMIPRPGTRGGNPEQEVDQDQARP